MQYSTDPENINNDAVAPEWFIRERIEFWKSLGWSDDEAAADAAADAERVKQGKGLRYEK